MHTERQQYNWPIDRFLQDDQMKEIRFDVFFSFFRQIIECLTFIWKKRLERNRPY